MPGGGFMKRTGSHHDGVCRCPEEPHNETVRRVESADIASSGFAGDFVAHHPVNSAHEVADHIGPFGTRRREPQVATVSAFQFLRQNRMRGRFPAVDQRADDLAADAIPPCPRLRHSRHIPGIHYRTAPCQPETPARLARVHNIEVDAGSPNRSRDRKGALLALPIDLTLPYGRGSDWSTPYARILSLGRHLRKAHFCVAHPPPRTRCHLMHKLMLYCTNARDAPPRRAPPREPPPHRDHPGGFSGQPKPTASARHSNLSAVISEAL